MISKCNENGTFYVDYGNFKRETQVDRDLIIKAVSCRATVYCSVLAVTIETVIEMAKAIAQASSDKLKITEAVRSKKHHLVI